MPVRWNTWRVIEAADKIDQHIDAATEPLNCARDVAKEALQIPNLPQYLTQRIRSLITEIEYRDHGLRNKVEAIRKAVPKDAIEGDRKASEYGETLRLV